MRGLVWTEKSLPLKGGGRRAKKYAGIEAVGCSRPNTESTDSIANRYWENRGRGSSYLSFERQTWPAGRTRDQPRPSPKETPDEEDHARRCPDCRLCRARHGRRLP